MAGGYGPVVLGVVLDRVDLRGVGDIAACLPRPEPVSEGSVAAVREIIDAVRSNGDAALARYTEQFDGAVPPTWRVAPDDVAAARDRVDPALRVALEAAADSIAEFHQGQASKEQTHARQGITIRSWDQPVGRAGCYVPGGRAAYPSTVLMTALPARAAGVEEVALCVPPGPDGRVADVTLAAAAVAGVDEVYAVGGAQAIAAMAYGTESIGAVDVIVGPGNVYVAIAKQLVAGSVGVPAAFAGPSEVVVVVDGATPAEYAAVDLIVQAEHGPDGLAWLITWDAGAADAVTDAVADLLVDAPRSDDIAATFDRSGHVVLVDGPESAAEVVNFIAPEHLQVMTEAPEAVIDRVRNAGAIFRGPLAPASIGDYMAGPSHVLPTNGTARFAGALSVRDFTKPMHEISVDAEGLAAVGPHVAAIADAEGLDAHAQSIRLRGFGDGVQRGTNDE
ncbi:MAG: histidinol dehydrogenase [Acidimicrobiia bacterium]|nr:histidinol dehydrogenase [Acidimicrobiia bacterium]MYG57956.1 histidinol dehydrogenase [Acidimicrobiia bacterium]MYJ33075.1 histidinol dehydrogenase [Acidimicrobiia bacterium]